MKLRKKGDESMSLDKTSLSRTYLSNDCDATTAHSHATGQIEGANDQVATAIKTAMYMRECQFAIRIEYMAR
jgi:hypothetical protein